MPREVTGHPLAPCSSQENLARSFPPALSSETAFRQANSFPPTLPAGTQLFRGSFGCAGWRHRTAERTIDSSTFTEHRKSTALENPSVSDASACALAMSSSFTAGCTSVITSLSPSGESAIFCHPKIPVFSRAPTRAVAPATALPNRHGIFTIRNLTLSRRGVSNAQL
jgi:hypothetical protein